MPSWMRIVNNFVHDLATGFWLALVLVEFGLRRELSVNSLLAAGRPVLRLAFAWAVGSLVVIILTGVIRTVTYHPPAEPERTTKRQLLWAKHVLLGGAFGLGTLFAYRLAFA